VAQSVADRVGAALAGPVPRLGAHRRLWLVGTGPFHDAAELGTFTFAGSGRSAAAVAGEGHTRLGDLLGPQDACVLVGGDTELSTYARRVAAGAGAVIDTLDVGSDRADDPTDAFAIAAARVLALCRSLDAPGVTGEDLSALVRAVRVALSAPPSLSRAALGRRVIVMGSGPAAVTARHLAVVLRRTDPSIAVEGLDAQDVPGSAAGQLGPGTVVLALDPGRDPTAPVARMARMAAAERASVVARATPPELGPAAAQIPLALGTARALRR
jgi:hypothetical protein